MVLVVIFRGDSTTSNTSEEEFFSPLVQKCEMYIIAAKALTNTDNNIDEM